MRTRPTSRRSFEFASLASVVFLGMPAGCTTNEEGCAPDPANQLNLGWVAQLPGGRIVGAADTTSDGFLVAGDFTEDTAFVDGALVPHELLTRGERDCFFGKLDSTGRVLWIRTLGGPDDDFCWAIQGAPDGGAFLRGFAGRDAFTGITADLSGRAFVAKLDSAGEFVWVRSDCRSASMLERPGMVTMPDGGVTVTGWFGYSDCTIGPGEPNETSLGPMGDWDVYVARFGSDGQLLWVKHDGGNDLDIATGIALLPSGDIVVTGVFAGRATFGSGEPAETVLDAAEGAVDTDGPWDMDYFLMGIDAEGGGLMWAARVLDGFGYGDGPALVGDGAGGFCFVASADLWPDSVVVDPGLPDERELTASGLNGVIACWDPERTVRWAAAIAGAHFLADSISALPSDRVAIGGVFAGDIRVDDAASPVFSGVPDRGGQMFYLELDASGHVLRAKRDPCNECPGGYTPTVDAAPGSGILFRFTTGSDDRYFGYAGCHLGTQPIGPDTAVVGFYRL